MGRTFALDRAAVRICLRFEAMSRSEAGQHSIRINEVMRERRGITADTALHLARCIDTSPQFWLNPQSACELRLAEINAGKQIAREVTLLEVSA